MIETQDLLEAWKNAFYGNLQFCPRWGTNVAAIGVEGY